MNPKFPPPFCAHKSKDDYIQERTIDAKSQEKPSDPPKNMYNE